LDEWINEVTLDMLPETWQGVVNKIGIKVFLELTRAIGGTTIYVPKQDTFEKYVRNMKIRKEYKGYNIKELALKYNISARWVAEICEEHQMEGQTNLFA